MNESVQLFILQLHCYYFTCVVSFKTQFPPLYAFTGNRKVWLGDYCCESGRVGIWNLNSNRSDDWELKEVGKFSSLYFQVCQCGDNKTL